MRKVRTITLKELVKTGIQTYSVKNNSPRGCETKTIDEVKIGDKVVIDNYFTLVVQNI